MAVRTNEVNAHKSVEQAKSPSLSRVPKGKQSRKISFKKVLNQRLVDKVQGQRVQFSAHAQGRLDVRQINLTSNDMAKIESAIDRASQKGATDSLLLMDDLAMIVSVKNRTVVTVVDSDRMKDNVFTNIDSAIIV